MKTPLLSTQEADVERIAEKEDLPNFSEPGTGKTLTTIGAIERVGLQSGVVVCPTVATFMWARTLEEELGAKVQHLKSRSATIDRTADFYVMSYGVVAEQAVALSGVPCGALVIDESHYVKSRDAIRTTAIFGPNCDGIGGLYEESSQCWCLSGTPMERYADDLWSQLRATQPEALERYNSVTLEAFQRQFCRMQTKMFAGGKVQKYVSTANQNEKLLNRMLYQDIGAIRRTMDEVDPFMPETRFRDIFVKAKVSAELKSLLMGKTEQEIIEAIMEGGDAITRARRLMGLAKVDDVLNYVKENARHHQVLVGFWHEDVGKEIYKRLTGDGFATNLIYGGTSAAARDRIRTRFMEGEIDIIVGQIQAMGVAMDGLQHAAWHVIMAERDWSWAKTEQFYKRLARKGQKHSVQVDFCTSGEAVDTAIEKISQSKAAGMKEIIG